MQSSEALSFLDEHAITRDRQTKVSWLEDYESPIWKLIGGKSVNIHWDRPLPNGTNLLDDENTHIRDIAKQFIIKARSLNVGREVSNQRLYLYSNLIHCLIDWAIENNDRFLPNRYGFSLLDSDAIKEITFTYVSKGVCGLCFINERIDRFFKALVKEYKQGRHSALDNHSFPDSILKHRVNLPYRSEYSNEELLFVRKWLLKNGCYKNLKTTSLKSFYYINRNRISELVGIHSRHAFGPREASFLKQFEAISDYELFDLRVTHSTKAYLPDDYVSAEEAAARSLTIGTSRRMTDLYKLMMTLTEFMEGLPVREAFGNVQNNKFITSCGALEDNYHRTTPVDIALDTLNRSIEYVLLYGESIVDVAIEWAELFASLKTEALEHKLDIYHPERLELFKSLDISATLEPLNILSVTSHWNNKSEVEYNEAGGHLAGRLCRKNMPLEDATKLLFAAVYILIASMSTRRKSEIHDLKVDCLSGSTGSYNIQFLLGKANVEQNRALITRPIPDVVAKGINQLKRLLESWERISGNKIDRLFTIPIGFHELDKVRNGSSNMEIYIWRFCDYIGTKKPLENRRWYHKNHEFRRFFAMIFFWQYKFANLAAVSWMLGHVDARHTYHYIRETVGGKEMNAEEAKYSADAITGEDQSDALETLRQLTRDHFNTSDISIIDRDELEFYLESLIEEEVFRVRPYGFDTSEGERFDMVFEILKEIDNEQ